MHKMRSSSLQFLTNNMMEKFGEFIRQNFYYETLGD